MRAFLVTRGDLFGACAPLMVDERLCGHVICLNQHVSAAELRTKGQEAEPDCPKFQPIDRMF